MPVSILCFMELRSEKIPDGFLDTLDQLFDSQDEVVASYTESYAAPPSLTSHRGLILFQQVEDPKIILGSGQWPSSAVCADWFSKYAPAFMAELEPLHRAEAMETALVDGFIFSDIESGESSPMFDATRLEITRWRIPTEQREQFSSAIDALERQKAGSGASIFRSWRVDDWPPRPDSDTVKECFLIVSCNEGAPTDGGLSEEEALCNKLSISVEKKHFVKAL